MARTIEQLTEAIEKAVAMRSYARSQEARDQLREKISYLKGELMLQRAKEAREDDAGLGVGLWAGNPTRLASK